MNQMDEVPTWNEFLSILIKKYDETTTNDEVIRYDFDSNFNAKAHNVLKNAFKTMV